MASGNTISTLSFALSSPNSTTGFCPRLGHIVLRRRGTTPNINFDTPSILTTTSRGVVPHLSRDHHKLTNSIRWVNVPFETFLDHTPPIPTMQLGKHPLHTFLGYPPAQHVLSMSIRDPSDRREMPSNGNGHISAYCIRGVRKVTPPEWRSYVLACKPDLVMALSDIPFTKPPHSQKRLTKSIERSAAWLLDILRPVDPISDEGGEERPNVLVHMAGGSSIPARQAFSDSLVEVLYGKDAEAINPFRCLDQGVVGYVFDLVPLRLPLQFDDKSEDVQTASYFTSSNAVDIVSEIVPMMRASLRPLSKEKLRLVNSTRSPHEILRLIQYVGIDLFDAHWAQHAADIGVALDFQFPVSVMDAHEGKGLRTSENGKRDLGHNLYDPSYAHDFSRLAECFLDGFSYSTNDNAQRTGIQWCPCVACSPTPSLAYISHCSLDSENSSMTEQSQVKAFLPPSTRAYLHHLLHTHEMSAHSLLVMHNLAVLNAFFAGVRSVLAHVSSEGPDVSTVFATEVEKFVNKYDEELAVFDRAARSWKEVEKARGKGRLAREREKQEQSTPWEAKRS